MSDSFGARGELEVSGETYEIHRLDALQEQFDVARLPYSLKVLLENVLRLEDGDAVTSDDVETIAKWDAKADPSEEIPFQPARVLMQDFTGVPAVVDLAAMRDAMEELGGDASDINPRVPVDLIIDHSVQVDAFGLRRRSTSTPTATTSETRSATASCAGARPHSTASGSCRPRPGSATRSTSNTWAAWCSPPRTATAASPPTPTRWSGPTRTRP